ncbi:MAG: hypothetical protein ACYDAA_01545 [Syntrophales bacterium]
MKKLCLIILFVLLLPVTSSLAITRQAATGQEIFIPYSAVGGGWWSGLVINNISDSTMTFSISVFKEDGVRVDGNSVSVAAHAMKVDVLENFFGGNPPDDRMSVLIQTGSNESFGAALLVGNNEGGFGIQNYSSSDSTGTTRFPVVVKWNVLGQVQVSTDIYIVNLKGVPVSLDLDLYSGDGALSGCGVMPTITIPANGTRHINPSGCFAIAMGVPLNFDGIGQINASSNGIGIYWRIYDESVSPHELIDHGKETP